MESWKMNIIFTLFGSVIILLFGHSEVNAQYIGDTGTNFPLEKLGGDNTTEIPYSPEDKIGTSVSNWYLNKNNLENIEDNSDSTNSFIRIEDETFQRQHLLTGKTIEDSDTSIGMIYAYFGLGLMTLIGGFFIFKKIKNRNHVDSRKVKKNKRINSKNKKE